MRKFRYIEFGHGEDSLTDHEKNKLNKDFGINMDGFYALMPVTKYEFGLLASSSNRDWTRDSEKLPIEDTFEDRLMPVPEAKTPEGTMNISSVAAERFIQMDTDIQGFIRQEVKAELNRREEEDDDSYYNADDNPPVKTGTVRICSVCDQIVVRDPYNPNYYICGCVDIGQLQLHHLTPEVWKPASVEIRMKKEKI